HCELKLKHDQKPRRTSTSGQTPPGPASCGIARPSGVCAAAITSSRVRSLRGVSDAWAPVVGLPPALVPLALGPPALAPPVAVLSLALTLPPALTLPSA